MIICLLQIIKCPSTLLLSVFLFSLPTSTETCTSYQIGWHQVKTFKRINVSGSLRHLCKNGLGPVWYTCKQELGGHCSSSIREYVALAWGALSIWHLLMGVAKESEYSHEHKL